MLIAKLILVVPIKIIHSGRLELWQHCRNPEPTLGITFTYGQTGMTIFAVLSYLTGKQLIL